MPANRSMTPKGRGFTATRGKLAGPGTPFQNRRERYGQKKKRGLRTGNPQPLDFHGRDDWI